MNTSHTLHGWERLTNGFDVLFSHRIPVRISNNGGRLTMPVKELLDEVAALAGLQPRKAADNPG